ncbi:MAG: HEAT repeat domain-containing protein [Deltaproteobacteria bacterium]|nr:HEAT repeat domain-containing protein [Deltaproteobacteria bacterium]
MFNTLGSNTDAFKKALTLIINNDKHQTKSTVGMVLNEITVNDGETLEKLEFWIDFRKKLNGSQDEVLNQKIIKKYVDFLKELRGNEEILSDKNSTQNSDQNKAQLFADIMKALSERVPATINQEQIKVVREILRAFKQELPENKPELLKKESALEKTAPDTEALQVILNAYNSLRKGVNLQESDKIKLAGFREAFMDIVWKSNQKESFLTEVINNMSDSSDSQRHDNYSAIFELIKNKNHNELASLLVKILGSNTNVLTANNASRIVVHELEKALQDTKDLELKNRFKEILKKLVLTEQDNNNRDYFISLLSSKTKYFSIDDKEKYALWSKVLQVKKQFTDILSVKNTNPTTVSKLDKEEELPSTQNLQHKENTENRVQFTSNDRLVAVRELATITDAKLISKVALLFWDVLYEDYNSKDNNVDVVTERDILFRNLYEIYSNNKIFNNKDNPYPTSPKAISVLNHMLKDKNFNPYLVLDSIDIATKIDMEGSVVISALIRVLKDQDKDIRYAAAVALGEIEGPAAIPALIEALKDEEYCVRQVAAEALGKIEAAHPGSTTAKQKDSGHSSIQAGSAETTQKESDREQ